MSLLVLFQPGAIPGIVVPGIVIERGSSFTLNLPARASRLASTATASAQVALPTARAARLPVTVAAAAALSRAVSRKAPF